MCAVTEQRRIKAGRCPGCGGVPALRRRRCRACLDRVNVYERARRDRLKPYRVRREAVNLALVIGQVFSRWTVLADAGQGRWGNRLVRCRCICGTEKVVSVKCLRNGSSLSCGCYSRDRIRQEGLNAVHGEASNHKGKKPSVEYSSWAQIVQKKNAHRVCPRWRDSFSAFLADVGRRPAPGYTLCCLKPEVGYYPGNYVWLPTREAKQYRSTNRLIRFNKQVKPVAVWAAQFGLPKDLIYQRLKKGWSPKKALTTPVAPRLISVEIDGQVKTLAEWATTAGIRYQSVYHRYKRGVRGRALLEVSLRATKEAPMSALATRIYFIKDPRGFVKIGITSGPVFARLSELQVGNPTALRIMGTAVGSRTQEQALHEKYKTLRVRGEWFKLRPTLQREIRTLCAA